MDFINIPKVSILDSDDVHATLEKLEDDSYKAILENRSMKSEDKKTVTISIKAETEDELAESEITVMLYPEGISIDALFDEEKRLIVRTEETENEGSMDPLIKPTRLKITLAILDQSSDKPKAIICDMKDVVTSFSPLGGQSEVAINLRETFSII